MSSTKYAIEVTDNVPKGRQAVAIGALLAMGYLCIFELCIIIFTTFRHRDNLYFWSVAAAIAGAAIYSTGCTLHFFAPVDWPEGVSTGFFCVGYLIYVLAEFLVLYSRLHLVSASRKTLRFILALIVTEYALVTIPTAIIAAGAFASDLPAFSRANPLSQRIEIVIYMATEMAISVTYIRQVLQAWGSGSGSNLQRKRVLKRMICANVFLICLDSCTVIIEFTGHPDFMAAALVCTSRRTSKAN
jgi:hypothetical protein